MITTDGATWVLRDAAGHPLACSASVFRSEAEARDAAGSFLVALDAMCFEVHEEPDGFTWKAFHGGHHLASAVDIRSDMKSAARAARRARDAALREREMRASR